MHLCLITKYNTYILEEIPENMNRQEKGKCKWQPHSITKNPETESLGALGNPDISFFNASRNDSGTMRWDLAP